MMKRSILLSCLLSLASCTKPSPTSPAAPPTAPPAAPPTAQTAPVTAPPSTPPAPPPAPSVQAQAKGCSASALSPMPSASKSALPPPVEAMRQHIVTAAVACDYDALARLAHEKGEEFSFGFEEDKDVAAYWRKQEQAGQPVLAHLVKVLSLPSSHEESLYVWPSAYGAEAKDADWKALEALYPPERIAELRKQPDGYTGFRVGIDASGDWMFALGGD